MEIRRNLPALFLHSVREYPRDDLFMVRQKGGVWDPISSREALDTIKEIAGGFLADGLQPGSRVGILSENRPEWVMTDIATHFCRCADVPVYATLPANQVQFILQNAELRFLVVSTATQAAKIQSIRDQLPLLERVYCLDADVEGAEHFSQLRERGREYLKKHPGILEAHLASIDPEELATIIYTSGTTGNPKGVMLTHANFCANVGAAAATFDFLPGDLAISFLPLSHVLERMVLYVFLDKGVGIAHVRRIERVADALQEIRPHVFVTVPRLLERAFTAVQTQVGSRTGVGGLIARKAFGWGLKGASKKLAGKTPRSPGYRLADKAIFSKIREKMGGRLRFVIAGGAALPEQPAKFFWAAGIQVYEGYGLTETAPVLAVNRPGEVKIGTVGPPVDNVDIRIADDGEIIARGPNIMKGYWKRQEDTEEVLRGDWFYTGDLGHIDEDGFLCITGRKKEIIVLSTGKNIGPRSIEAAIEKSRFINRVVAVGDEKPSIGLLILPNLEQLLRWAKERDLPCEDERALLELPEVRHHYEQEIGRLQSGVAAFEKAKKFAFLEEELSEDNGMLTPTQKVRRREVNKQYKDTIDNMYG